MADYQLDKDNSYIEYMKGAGDDPSTKVQNAMGLFLYGGTGADGRSYPKVDMSLWDQATMCATCHVGGSFYEHDRLGNRLPARLFSDWGAAMTQTGLPSINPITTTVWENYSTNGKDKSFVTYSPWAYPQFVGNNPANDPVTAPYGWGPAGRNGDGVYMADPNTGAAVHVVPRQLMMPNVKEMDCMFCHLKGYDNVMASVATQAGSLSMAPMIGGGLMDMFPLSPSFQGYNGANVSFAKAGAAFGPYSSMQTVTLTDATVSRILAKPDDNNCMQCHATKTLKDFPEMFGVTGNSSGFLSSAPMVYDPANPFGPLGKRMVSYDINAPFTPMLSTSPVLDSSNVMSMMMPGLSYTQANGPTPFNSLKAGELGGGNVGMTGPLYYYNSAGQADQNTLKRSSMPFARAEWFKRGDTWQLGQDVHSSLGCAGCHFTGNSTDKNQCDPGRGFDMASTIQDGIPHFQNRGPDLEGLTVSEVIKKHDTRNTVKRCEFCHITHTDYNGNAIDTFGAMDPTVAHQNAGLLANITQVVDKQSNHGTYGGKGVPRETNLTTQENGTTAGGTILGRGNHLDVMDCTVCHVQKVSMAVRSLDATSGMRFPAIVGTDPSRGMLGLFEDPTGMGADATHMGGKLQEWKPLLLWQALGNMEEPLSTSYLGAENKPADSRFKFRRKMYLSNAISAVLWNNEDPTIDANGDGAKGGLLIGDDPATLAPRSDNSTKDSLIGFRDVFSGDVPDENNTQGFGIPIFDPWIMHDLKAGFNFAPGPLSVISTGFGGFGTPTGMTDPTAGAYQSLYGPDGMFAENAKWPFASVWSGAVVFTEPDQIRAYKQYRSAIKNAGDGKSWDQTRLTYVGAPFMVTHGVKGTATYVKGGKDELNPDGSVKVKHGCTDCHAANKGFFTGGFDMVGPALPATKSYDPSTYPLTNPDGTVQINPVTGDVVRPAAQGWSIPNDNGNMMMRPLEPVRVKAKQGDLRAYLETNNKLGQPREVSFVQTTTNTEGEKFDYISAIDRSQALYPDADGRIYYRITDINPDGTLVGNPTALLGSQYANYLETGIDTSNLANYGIGVAPKATINPVTDIDATQTGIQVPVRSGFAVSAALAQPNADKSADIGTVTYAWSTSDTDAVITGADTRNANITFQSTGSKTITLKVADEEGKVSSTYVTVYAVVPPVAIQWTHTAAPATGTAAISNIPATTKYVKIIWGDGNTVTQTITVGATSTTANHAYATTATRTIQVYLYNASSKQTNYMQQVITP